MHWFARKFDDKFGEIELAYKSGTAAVIEGVTLPEAFRLLKSLEEGLRNNAFGDAKGGADGGALNMTERMPLLLDKVFPNKRTAGHYRTIYEFLQTMHIYRGKAPKREACW